MLSLLLPTMAQKSPAFAPVDHENRHKIKPAMQISHTIAVNRQLN
jgi:hypothetical protein